MAVGILGVIVAMFIASAGLWWFITVLGNMKSKPLSQRYGIYTLIWLAYFILVIILIQRLNS